MKKRMIQTILVLFGATMLLSCGNSIELHSQSENNKTAQSNDAQKYDRSSPEATFKTLITASIEKDKEGLSLCFSEESAGEFERIVNRSLSEEDLNELKEMFENATIKSTKIHGDHALLSVKLSIRDEEISMRKENDNWVILDF